MDTVNAGLVTKILKKFWDSLKKEFKAIGYEVKDIKEEDNGVRVITIWVGSDSKYAMEATCKPINYSEASSKDSDDSPESEVGNSLLKQGVMYDIQFTSKDKRPKVVQNVKSEDLVKTCKKVAEEWFGDTEVTTVAGSGYIKTTLLKTISANNQISVDLVTVEADYDPQAVLLDLSTLTDSAEFVDSLPDNSPAFLDIAVSPTELEYKEVSSLETPVAWSIKEIMKAIWCTYVDALYLSYYMVGSGAPSDATACCEDARWMAQSQFDRLSTYCIELGVPAPHPADISETGCELCTMNTNQRMLHIFNRVTSVIAAIDLYYCNFEKEFQSLLDNWLLGWKNLAYYRMREIPQLAENIITEV